MSQRGIEEKKEEERESDRLRREETIKRGENQERERETRGRE